MFGLIKRTKAAALLVNALQKITVNSIALTATPVYYGYNTAAKHIDAYTTIDDLYSVVNKIDSYCKQIPLFVYEVRDEKAFSKYRLISRKIQQSKNYNRKTISDLSDLQTKALEIIGENDPVQKLLDKPNEYESKDEFYSALYTFPLLTGNDYVIMNAYNEGYNKGRPFELFHISPEYVLIVPSNTLPRRAVEYQYTLYNYDLSFEAADVMHRKYFNPEYDYTGSELYGLSPLASANKLLTQLSNERDYLNRSLINAGAEGFINNDDPDFDVETWGSVKEDLIRELGATVDRGGTNLNAKKLGVLLGKWKYNQIGISPADMNLVEQGKISFKKLCNIFGISDRLFNNDSTGSEISIDKMLRDAFISVAIPEVAAVAAMFNTSLVPKFKDNKRRYVDYDISDVPQIQEDVNAIINRFAAAPAFRVADLFEATGWGRPDDPDAEVILVKQGYAPLDEVAQSADIELNELDKNGVNDYDRQ